LLPGSSYTTETAVVAQKDETWKRYYQCRNCLTVYDEAVGEPEKSINAGTSFDALPATCSCALCEAPKTDLVKIEVMQPALQPV